MTIDRIDLAILRHLERTGYWLAPLPHQLQIDLTEIKTRIARLQTEGVISSYKATIFVPPFLGGEWVWGCVLAITNDYHKAITKITAKIPFVSEIWINTNIPSKIGHNLAVVFYSKDFVTETKFLKELPDFAYLETYRIANYTYPLPKIFSTEEKQLLKAIVQHPTAPVEELSELCKKNKNWIETKLEKLIWHSQNPEGIIMVLPEIRYHKIQNFCHCHFVLEISGKAEVVLEELKTKGFETVLENSPFQYNFFQVETDLWGFDDLLRKKHLLESYPEIRIQGIVIAEEMRVISDWAEKLL
ncbi:MAG: hypothetical protein N2201_03135 [candidate division WOR-3 bacterium]|nr:hypothetical protein [candidate division WOR-3 bacterium]